MSIYYINSLEELKQVCNNAGNQLILMDMFANWCGPCKSLSPKIDLFARQYPNTIFIKVDVDIAEDIANNFKITSMPTIIFIKNYIEIDRVIGANIQKIEEILKKHVWHR